MPSCCRKAAFVFPRLHCSNCRVSCSVRVLRQTVSASNWPYMEIPTAHERQSSQSIIHIIALFEYCMYALRLCNPSLVFKNRPHTPLWIGKRAKFPGQQVYGSCLTSSTPLMVLMRLLFSSRERSPRLPASHILPHRNRKRSSDRVWWRHL
jgi:hypothetical protein